MTRFGSESGPVRLKDLSIVLACCNGPRAKLWTVKLNSNPRPPNRAQRWRDGRFRPSLNPKRAQTAYAKFEMDFSSRH